jgi:hypothetical protein
VFSLLQHGLKRWLKHPCGNPDVKPGERYWREEPQQKRRIGGWRRRTDPASIGVISR